jgi:hypothetical protein
MPTVAVRRPETDAVKPEAASHEAAFSVSETISAPQRPLQRSETSAREWREFAPYVETFSGLEGANERARKRRMLRHRRFVMSAPFWAGVFVLIELLALLWVMSLRAQVLRQADAVDNQIKLVELENARTFSKLGAAVSPARLHKWAGELGYRPAKPIEMDDVTSNAPFVPMTATDSP